MANLQDIAKLDKHKPGEYVHVIDRARCEGCGQCVSVCPNGVLELRALSQAEKHQLPFFARLRVTIHGNKQSWVVSPNACEGCGLCVVACEERAIILKKNSSILSVKSGQKMNKDAKLNHYGELYCLFCGGSPSVTKVTDVTNITCMKCVSGAITKIS